MTLLMAIILNIKVIILNIKLSIKEYHNMIRPYLRDMINYHKMQGESKVHSGNTVIDYKTQEQPSKDSDEIHTMHTKSNNMENMMSNEIDEIIEKLFESLLRKYQEGLEEKM